jgi:hypothetical protein
MNAEMCMHSHPLFRAVHWPERHETHIVDTKPDQGSPHNIITENKAHVGFTTAEINSTKHFPGTIPPSARPSTALWSKILK